MLNRNVSDNLCRDNFQCAKVLLGYFMHVYSMQLPQMTTLYLTYNIPAACLSIKCACRILECIISVARLKKAFPVIEI